MVGRCGVMPAPALLRRGEAAVLATCHFALTAQHFPAERIERQHRVAVLRFLEQALMEQGAHHIAPCFHGVLFADAVHAELRMSIIDQAL